MCLDVGGCTGRNGRRKGILDLRITAVQGQRGSCPYVEVSSSQLIIMD